ncbi:hypothetical protein PpBr36_03884 [Pyricularia pennisetigena]|uniref:hypothetical protein n=1 Tax=Pyricularia pennisetigena TaxID=1578925 RepID=UPI001152D5AD|nr:hypothetical protein PpBr36_03884 [Pyricularia pennisetigena]TLS29979.1 hypothetical protein PpBr36_03884 [Pyricularia pennisetigena]
MNTNITAGLANWRAEEGSTKDGPRHAVNAGNKFNSRDLSRVWSETDSDDYSRYEEKSNPTACTPSEPAAARGISSNTRNGTTTPSGSNRHHTEAKPQFPRQQLAHQPHLKNPAQLSPLSRGTSSFERQLAGEQKTPTTGIAKSWNRQTRAPIFPGASSSTSQGGLRPDNKPHDVNYLFNMISDHARPASARHGPDFPTYIRKLEDLIIRLRMKKETLKGVYIRTYNIDERASIKPRLDRLVKELECMEVELASVRKAYQAAEEIASSIQKAVDRAVAQALADAFADKQQRNAHLQRRAAKEQQKRGRDGADTSVRDSWTNAGNARLYPPRASLAPKPNAAWLAMIPEEVDSGRRQAQDPVGEHEPSKEPEQAPDPVVLRKPRRRSSLDWARGKVTNIFHR